MTFLLCAFIVTSCTNKKPQVDTFGELDKTVIAADTAMQADMDLSYEYQRTLVESDSVVYDFLAYDKPKYNDKKNWEAKFHIIRRTAHTQDTIMKGYRSEHIINLWLSDLDQNGRSEIMFYENPLQFKKVKEYFTFFAYEADGRKKAQELMTDFKQDDTHYKGGDTFFVYRSALIRQYPYYQTLKDSISKKNIIQSYKLIRGKLVPMNGKDAGLWPD